MRAVNLIPTDQRSGGSVGTGRSEGVVHGLLAVLAIVAVFAFLYGKASRDISRKESQVATINAQVTNTQAEATALTPYTSFVAMREQRAQDVATLVDSRFDWAHAFHEFGRVLTSQVAISSLDGSIVAPAAGAAATPPTTSAATTATTPAAATPATAAASVASATPPGSVPTFTLGGCATSQDAVALMLQQLRLIDGVAEVTLQSSTRSAGTASASSASAGGCTPGDPTFAVGVTFDPLPSTSEASAVATKAATTTVSDKNASGGAQG